MVLSKLKKIAKPGGFVGNVLTLMTGTTVAQGITIGVAPILTRLYTPEDFGLAALFVSITGIIALIITGRYEMAIMLPKEDEEAFNVAILSIGVAFGISLFIFLAVLLFNQAIAVKLGNPAIAPWLYFVPISLFVTGLFQVTLFWSNRKQRFKQLAAGRASQSSAAAITKLVGGFNAVGGGGIIVGNIVGQFVGASILGRYFTKFDLGLKKALRKTEVWRLAKKYRDFPLFTTWSSFLQGFSANVPVLFFTKFFSASVVGFYSLSERILGLPSRVVSTSVTQVFYQRMVEKHNNGQSIVPLLYKAASRLAIIGLVPLLTLSIFAPDLFAVIFGATWRTAGEYAQIVCFALFVKFIVSPMSVVLAVVDRLRVCSTWKACYFVTTISLFSFCSSLEIKTLLRVYTAHEMFMYAVYFSLIVWNAKRAAKKEDDEGGVAMQVSETVDSARV